MGICSSTVKPKCFWCEKSLHKNGPTILYSFQGCGKYHRKTICNLCLTDKVGYDISKLEDDCDLPTHRVDYKPYFRTKSKMGLNYGEMKDITKRL